MSAENQSGSHHRIISGGLTIVAATGWALFAWSAMTDGAADLSTQAELRRLLGALDLVTAERDQLTAERNQVLSQVGGLQEAQARRARVQEEVATLERMRVRLTEAVDQARARFGGGQDPTSVTDQGPDPSPASEGNLPQE